jgi:hypothetical protein
LSTAFTGTTGLQWPQAERCSGINNLTGHTRKGAHAGCGRQWIETLKAAVEVR